jgi:hypothetical protein
MASFKMPIGLSIYPRVHEVKVSIQVLSDVVRLEGVSIGVTRVSNKVKPCVIHACIIPQP